MKTLKFITAGILVFSFIACKPQQEKPKIKKAAVSKKGRIMKIIEPDMQKLLNPQLANEKAPEIFKTRFSTTRGDFVVEIHRDWSPNGADRFYNLVKIGFFNEIAFFRVLSGFVAQFGISGNPQISAKWRNAPIPDDPVKQSNLRGTLTFATAGPNTRTTQLFINYRDNLRLDQMGFSPLGKVIEGMNVVDSLYSNYGEGAPQGRGPNQGLIQTKGNEYLKSDFPKLDYIVGASLE